MHLLTVWMALFALLLGALAPTISHALAKKPSPVMLEICAVDGMRVIDISAQTANGETDNSGGSHHLLHMEDCPFCRIAAHTPMLLPKDWQFFPLPASAHPYPTLFYQAHDPLFAWAPAQSRAPPALS